MSYAQQKTQRHKKKQNKKDNTLTKGKTITRARLKQDTDFGTIWERI